MLINNVPVKMYGAKQLTVEFAPSTQSATYEWNAGARLPILVDNRATFKTLTVVLKVTGSSRQEINKNISHLHNLAAGETEYKLEKYPGWVFVGVLAEEPTAKKTIDPGVYKLTLKVTGYMRDEKQQEIDIDRVASQYVFADGTRDAPVMMEITPDFDLTEFTIKGVAEREITIKNLTKGSTIYIDGMNGFVTENGENKFNDVIMFEFPHLQAGEQLIEFSESVCHIVLRYYPMWL
jgi:phage-related protein